MSAVASALAVAAGSGAGGADSAPTLGGADSRLVVLRDGMELELAEHAPATPAAGYGGPLPLLLLHGFTGAAATWQELLPTLGQRRRVVAVSLPGHGASGAPEGQAHYTVQGVTAYLVELLELLQMPRVALLGYSMGGRVALHMALQSPERVGALVLESASPGIADATERAARARADEALATDIERDGLRAFVARWEGLPLWESQRQLPDEDRMRLRGQRLRGSARGLAAALLGLGAGTVPAVHDMLAGLATVPTLLLCGALDSRYVALARGMGGLLPRARVCVVDGAGHAVHLERPREFAREVTRFLDGVDGLDGDADERAAAT